MTDSIYNNAGMPGEQKGSQMSDGIDDGGRSESWSRNDKGDLVNDRTGEPFLASVAEQGAAPEIPESEFSVSELYVAALERIAALTLERDTLKVERDEPWKHSEHWRNPETGQVECDCCCGWALDAEQTAKEVAALKAKVERLSAPVSDEEPDTCEGCDKPLRDDEGHETDDMVMLCDECWQGCADDPDCHSEECPCEACAAKIGAMKHPINDDEQRRKDAAWNDRAKARCICGEMIAWYSGEWLHVASRSKSCADGRLASPVHFLVGMPPAEPEWQKEA